MALKQAGGEGEGFVFVVCLCVCFSMAVSPAVGGSRPIRPVNAWTVGVASRNPREGEEKKRNGRKISVSCGRRLELPNMPHDQSTTLVVTW